MKRESQVWTATSHPARNVIEKALTAPGFNPEDYVVMKRSVRRGEGATSAPSFTAPVMETINPLEVTEIEGLDGAEFEDEVEEDETEPAEDEADEQEEEKEPEDDPVPQGRGRPQAHGLPRLQQGIEVRQRYRAMESPCGSESLPTKGSWSMG